MTKISKAAWVKSKEICAPSGETPLNLGYELDVVRHRVARHIQETSDGFKVVRGYFANAGIGHIVLQNGGEVRFSDFILPDDESDVLIETEAMKTRVPLADIRAALDAAGYQITRK